MRTRCSVGSSRQFGSQSRVADIRNENYESMPERPFALAQPRLDRDAPRREDMTAEMRRAKPDLGKVRNYHTVNGIAPSRSMMSASATEYVPPLRASETELAKMPTTMERRKANRIRRSRRRSAASPRHPTGQTYL